MVRPLRLSVVALATVALAIGGIGCGSSSRARDANGPNRPLPGWSGHSVEVFDDSIEPAAVGLDFDRGYHPRGDAMLRERAQLSDAVLRVRVATVTAKSDGPDSVFHLGLSTVEKLAGEHPPPAEFTVTVSKSSESHGIMKSFESRLVGRGFVAFVREFVRPDGDRELHFHLAPDSKEVKLAVSDAVLLGELK